MELSKDVVEWIESYIPCQASVGTTVPPQMTVKETPNDVFEHVSMDFKGPIAGDFYLHLMTDNLSCYPVMKVVKST